MNDCQKLIDALLMHLQEIHSPNFFIERLEECQRTLSQESFENVCQVVIENINKESQELISQIQSLKFEKNNLLNTGV